MLDLVQNYIYFHHLETGCIIPQFPESVSDSMSAKFNNTEILGRSAPIVTYSGSGPRQVSIALKLHRDMLADVNLTNVTFLGEAIDPEEAINILIRTMEAAVLPKYVDATKAINPPVISVRIGRDIYIKGVCSRVQHEWNGPIRDDRYLQCDISFDVQEYNAYDAKLAKTLGKYRGQDSNVSLFGRAGL